MSNELDQYTHVDLLFPSLYLKAGDLLGKDVTVIIERIEPRHELKTAKGKEKKPVMYFRGKKKGLVLNRTNGKRLVKMYGVDPRAWIGKSVTLYADEVEAFGDMVDAIRIRAKVPGTNAKVDTAPEPPEPMVDEDSAPGEEPFDAIEAELSKRVES